MRLLPYIVLACSGAFFWSLSLRSLFYALMPGIAGELNLTGSGAGMVVAGLALGNALGNWSAGWLPGSPKARIMGGMLLSLPTNALMAAAGNAGILLGAAFLLGLGVGVYLPLGLALVVEAGGTSMRARYISVHEVGATFATFTGAAFVSLGLNGLGWRESLLGWSAIGFAALFLFSRVRNGGRAPGSAPRLRRIPLDGRLLCSCVLFGGTTLLLGGLISVLPLIMVRGMGVDQTVAAGVVGYTRLAGLAGVAIVGLRADRWGHARVQTGLQLLGLAGTGVMAMSGFGPIFVAGVAAVAVAAAGIVTVLPAVVAEVYPRGQREQALGTSIGVGGLVGSVAAPPLFGLLLDLGQPSAPMLLAAAATLGALAATRRLAAYRASQALLAGQR